MKLTIDRTRWLRGEKASFLLRQDDRKMCCLGFLGLACGATKKQILGKREPVGAPNVKWPQGTLINHGEGNSDLTYLLMGINDGQGIADADREVQIIDGMKRLGVEVEFIN